MIPVFVYYSAGVVRNTECWIRTNVPNLESFRVSLAYRCGLFVVADNAIVKNVSYNLRDVQFLLSADLWYLNLNSEAMTLTEINKQIRLVSKSSKLSEVAQYENLNKSLVSSVFTAAIHNSLPVYARR